MRFFKSFKLLHRRTKSDPLIITGAFAHDIHKHKKTASIPDAFLTVLPNQVPSVSCPAPHLNIRILDLETKNSHLRSAYSAAIDELAEVRSQLKTSRADLFVELHRGVRQTKENKNEIERLHEMLTQYEKFTQLVIDSGSNRRVFSDAHVALRDGHDVDQALASAISHIATDTDSPGVVSSTIGPRTQDEYMAALQLTLKSRMQLRESRKIAKFWRNIAKQDGQNEEIVTPSSSNISSIHETLGPERQKAVDALIATRRKNITGQLLLNRVQAPVKNPPVILDTSPGSPAGGKNISPLLLPSRSLSKVQNFPRVACLSPLASQSLKRELSKVSSTNRFPRWPGMPKEGRKALAPIDVNITNHTSVTSSHTKLTRKGDSESSNRCSPGKRKIQRQDENRSSRPSKSILSDSIKLSKEGRTQRVTGDRLHAMSPGVEHSDHILHSRSSGLSKIVEVEDEESEPTSASSSSSADATNQEWTICGLPDLDISFGSTAGTLTTTLSTALNKRHIGKVDMTKSRLPIPVFRTLKNLSFTKTSFAQGEDNQLEAKLSPTRLPVRSNFNPPTKNV